MSTGYKIKDNVANKFWSGNVRSMALNDQGKTWKTKAGAMRDLERYVRLNNRYRKPVSAEVPLKYPSTLEIVEVEITETPKVTHSIDKLVEKWAIKDLIVSKHGYLLGYFVDTMFNKGVLDQIEFIFELKKGENEYHVGKETTMAARAQLRLLGVKTRTFREFHGMFGMMDRSQAMKARLTLDVVKVIDFAELRKEALGLIK
jgi:hypothetical protein